VNRLLVRFLDTFIDTLIAVCVKQYEKETVDRHLRFAGFSHAESAQPRYRSIFSVGNPKETSAMNIQGFRERDCTLQIYRIRHGSSSGSPLSTLLASFAMVAEYQNLETRSRERGMNGDVNHVGKHDLILENRERERRWPPTSFTKQVHT